MFFLSSSLFTSSGTFCWFFLKGHCSLQTKTLGRHRSSQQSIFQCFYPSLSCPLRWWYCRRKSHFFDANHFWGFDQCKIKLVSDFLLETTVGTSFLQLLNFRIHIWHSAGQLGFALLKGLFLENMDEKGMMYNDKDTLRRVTIVRIASGIMAKMQRAPKALILQALVPSCAIFWGLCFHTQFVPSCNI